jgi:thioredoxin-related protein
MKYLLLIILNTLLFSQNYTTMQWLDNYDKAVKVAVQENKKILLIVTTNGCKWCGKLIHFTMNDPKVIVYAQENYVSLKLKENDPTLFPKYKSSIYPVSYILDTKGRIQKKLYGYKLANDYLKFLKN